jgi:hypothetical protein
MITINVLTITTLFGLSIIFSFTSIAFIKGIELIRKAQQ